MYNDFMSINPFSRAEMLLGREALEKLQNSHVAVLGLGGVGSYTAEALARAGLGKLTLVDHDTVSLSNLNRQIYALRSTLGLQKAEVAKARIADINPACEVRALPLFFAEETADLILDTAYSYVADAIDTVSAKLTLAVRAQETGIPLIACMGTGNKLDASQFRIGDIYETSGCPLCRVMRRELRQRGVEALRVVWSPELPRSQESGDRSQGEEVSGKRSVPGSVSFVPPVAGMLMAGYVVRGILAL